MATSLQIANLALTRIGHDALASAFSSSGNKASRWFDSNYEFIKDALLREHQWNFAIKRDVLTATTVYTISGATAANPVVITATAHGFSNSNTVYIAGIVGMTQINNRTFTAANVAANTFELSGEDGSAYTAYSSGGTAYPYVASEYRYQYTLPADCVRLLRINNTFADEYRVEGNAIYTDEGTVNIEYVADVAISLYDVQFVDLLAARLSAEICYYITDNQSLTEQAWKIYNNKMIMARGMDSREGTPRDIEADTWLNARI